MATYAVDPDGEKATAVGVPDRGSLATTLSLAVEITLTRDGEAGEVCGPVSADHTCLPSGVTARLWGKRPTLISFSAGL